MVDSILARRPWLSREGLYRYGFTTAQDDPAGAPGVLEAEVAERLIAAYRRATSDYPGEGRPADMWAGLANLFQGGLIDLLRTGDGVGLLGYLRCLPRQPAGHGFLQGEQTYQGLVGNNAEQARRALGLMDQLVGAAEAVGVLTSRCPEQGDQDAVPALSTADDLTLAIQEQTGIPLGLPPVFEDLFALDTTSGPIHLRGLMPAYAIWRLSMVLHHKTGKDLAEVRVGEIGAGAGYSAWAAYRAGAAAYSIFDLPEINVVQGYFLLKSLPPGTVELYGEGAPDAPGRARVRVLPGGAFGSVPPGTFDAVLNIDSLPEIARPVAVGYLDTVKRVSPLFFSINQEAAAAQTEQASQNIVKDVVRDVGGFRSVYRMANWVRAGYVDELWETGGP
jgi:hypothetical protein